MLFERFKGDICFQLLRVGYDHNVSSAEAGGHGAHWRLGARDGRTLERRKPPRGGGFHGGGGVWVRRPGRVSQTRQTRTPAAIARERDRGDSARDRPWPLRGR